MAGYNYFGTGGVGYGANGYPAPNQTAGIYGNYGPQSYPQPQPQPQPMNLGMVYVHGIEGANAYQLPQGVTEQILWDDDLDMFYIKKLDQMGRPKVVAWKDFHDHVEPEAKQQDTSAFLTKEDLRDFLNKIGVSNFLTKSDLDKALSELSVGAGGRIVRGNEFNA